LNSYKIIAGLLLIAFATASQAQEARGTEVNIHRCGNKNPHWLVSSVIEGEPGTKPKARLELNSVVDLTKIIGPAWAVIAFTCTDNGFSIDTRATNDAKRSRQIEIRLLTAEKNKFEVWYKDKGLLSFSYKPWPIDKQMTL
jgi:hypothetical protein